MKTLLISVLNLFFVFDLLAQNNYELGSDLLKFDSKWIFSQDSAYNRLPMYDSLNRPLLSNLKLSTEFRLNRPQFNSNFNFKTPVFTKDFDYTVNNYSLIPLNSQSWITTARINSNYIGLGGLSSAGVQFNYLINDFVFYSGGVSFSKYNVYNIFNNSLQFNSNFRFQLTDRVFFNAFGNYTTPGDSKSSLFRALNTSMYPQTNYGGSFEFKVNNKWGVITGAEREFDPFKGKWVTRPFIMPVFYSK